MNCPNCRIALVARKTGLMCHKCGYVEKYKKVKKRTGRRKVRIGERGVKTCELYGDAFKDWFDKEFGLKEIKIKKRIRETETRKRCIFCGGETTVHTRTPKTRLRCRTCRRSYTVGTQYVKESKIGYK